MLKDNNQKITIIFISILIVIVGFVYQLVSRPIEEIIELPQPMLTSFTSLEETFINLNVETSFKSNPLNLENLTQILWAAQGITDPVLKFRTVPSAGALYPLEIYVIVDKNGVEGIHQGVYLFKPDEHILLKKSQEDLKSKLSVLIEVEKERVVFETAPVNLVVTAVYERTTTKYFERGVQYVHIEAGCVIQNIRLQTTSLKLSAHTILNFNEPSVQSLLNSPAPLFIMSIGIPANQIAFDTTISNGKEKSIDLPPPRKSSNVSFETATTKRRSIRKFGEDNVSLPQVAQILWASGRLSSDENYPVDVYLCVGEVAKLDRGVYHYYTNSHTLIQLSDEGVREKLSLATDQEWISECRFIIILAVRYEKAEIKYNEIGKRLAQFDAGKIVQNIHLQVAALNLGSGTVGAFNDTLVQEALSIPSTRIPLILMPIGPRSLE